MLRIPPAAMRCSPAAKAARQHSRVQNINTRQRLTLRRDLTSRTTHIGLKNTQALRQRKILCSLSIGLTWRAKVYANHFAFLRRVQGCEELASSHQRWTPCALENTRHCPCKRLLPLVPLQRGQAFNADAETLRDAAWRGPLGLGSTRRQFHEFATRDLQPSALQLHQPCQCWLFATGRWGHRTQCGHPLETLRRWQRRASRRWRLQ